MFKTNLSKRKLIILLALTLVISAIFLSGCSKKAEKGKVKNVTVSKEESSKDKSKNVFTKYDSPFNYQYKKVNNGRAYMHFEIPSSWQANVDNARSITITTPYNDKHLTGCTLHVIYNYGQILTDDDSEQSMSLNARTFADFFQYELAELTFNVNRSKYHLATWEAPNKLIGDPEFAGNDPKAAALFISTDVNLVDAGGNPGPDGYDLCTYFVRWQNIPCAFSILVPDSQLDAAKSMLSYIVSSITYMPSKLDSQNTYKLRDCTVKLPSDMQQVEKLDNCIQMPFDKTSNDLAGIGFGTFVTNTKDSPEVDSNSIGEYGAQIASSFAEDGYKCTASATDSKFGASISGKNATVYDLNVTYYYNEEDPRPGTYFGQPSNWQMRLYVTSAGKSRQHIAALLYQPNFQDFDILDKMIRNSLKYN